jgi:hypothetical protein
MAAATSASMAPRTAAPVRSNEVWYSTKIDRVNVS